MSKRMFRLNYMELLIFTTHIGSKHKIITNIHERFLLYEAYRRKIDNEKAFNLKWAESTLRLSFPKVHSMVERLITKGYLSREQDVDDGRVLLIGVTDQTIQGIETYENMRLNELYKLGLTKVHKSGVPPLSELSLLDNDLDDFRKNILTTFK